MCEVRKSSIDTSLHFGVKKYVYSPYIAMGRVLLWVEFEEGDHHIL